jgi:hypothetical protein
MFNNPSVEFISDIPGLSLIDECKPQPIQKFIPEWWKDMPNEKTTHDIDKTTFGNAKVCPSFADYFSNGFVIPMWVDSYLYYNNEEDVYKWRTASEIFEWSTHPNHQYIDNVSHKYMGKDSYFIFKILCPWRVITSPGYSLYQLPTFYNFNEDFSAVPGVRDSSIYHEMNIQILIHSNKKEIFIPRGTPLAHYIPFKKEKIKYDVREKNNKDAIKLFSNHLNLRTKFRASDIYKKEKNK